MRRRSKVARTARAKFVVNNHYSQTHFCAHMLDPAFALLTFMNVAAFLNDAATFAYSILPNRARYSPR